MTLAVIMVVSGLDSLIATRPTRHHGPATPQTPITACVKGGQAVQGWQDQAVAILLVYLRAQRHLEVHVEVLVPEGTRSKAMQVEVRPSHIKVVVLGKLVFEGTLYGVVRADETVWTLEDKKLLHIAMSKADACTKENLWEGLLSDRFLADPFVLLEMRKKLDLEHFQMEVRGGLWLQGADHDALVQRVARHNLPVVEHAETEGLALCVHTQIRLKAEGVDGWDKGLDGVEWRAGHRCILRHMATPLGEHRVHRGDTVCWRLDLHEVVRLHEARRGHQEGGVGHTAGRGDDLATAAVQRLLGNHSVQDLELAVPDGLLTQRPLTGPPLEALHDGVPHGGQQVLVHLGRQCVVHQDVWPTMVWPKGPDGTGGQHVPVNSPRRRRSQEICTTSPSMSSARPRSRGSAIMVTLLRLLGVSAKHLREEVSTTVSQKLTTGSATLMSISEYILRRSCITQSRYSSPVPRMTCSPDSSTRLLSSGYDLFTLRRPSSILGSSEGFTGSTAILITDWVLNLSGRKMWSSLAGGRSVRVDVLTMGSSMPSISTQFPAGTAFTSMLYRPSDTHSRPTVSTRESSSSISVYFSPNTRTSWLARMVPEMTRPNTWKVVASSLGYCLVVCTTSGPSGSHCIIVRARSLSIGPV
ncbi:NudC domain-containing protein 2 [Portunus trituberculatus]|uniref:NudC domain-containing protein 2 n=1 Tax=Portunus trituberculatus TaxID=210409 RepID=A0A5B7CTZ5_PORTR|nr:NudC domain-containing protein 2 [Portunus trituberculatus]